MFGRLLWNFKRLGWGSCFKVEWCTHLKNVRREETYIKGPSKNIERFQSSEWSWVKWCIHVEIARISPMYVERLSRSFVGFQ
jgi:hypothetical protein